ncbi:unnamed protein product [Echinostoma caproni]|uniref:40S ribosomal protein SA n=1 Tax=Echinostoma caproni TaxID=27848 RepID=A0A183BCI2_9TREM|nr:unnamed protein product [Echinostoma caproni]
MSGGLPVLELTEDDLRLMLVAGVFLGETTLNYQMSGYVYGRSKEGNHIIKVNKTWEKILLAARAIAAVDNPADVCAIGCKPYAQRAVLKFANYTRTTAIAGRFTPGAFTNQKQVTILTHELSPSVPLTHPSTGTHSVAVCWWLLAREVRRMRGEDIRSQPWNVMVDLFLYRDPKEEEQELQEEVDEAVMQPALAGINL